jgi:RHS repeat-associated protein
VWNRAYNYAATNNRLLTTEVNNNTTNYTYNEHGSMSLMPHLQNMEWDFAERLKHVTKGTTEAYYNYDGSGERVRKVVEKNNGGTVETRLYLGGFEVYRKIVNNNLELERETLHVMDDKKRIALVEMKTYDNGQIANPAIAQRYQLSNNIESATLELDESASIISYEEYYPYGDTSYQAGRSVAEVGLKRYRYTGKEKDEESGLYYMLARYYSGWLSRWTAADPAGLVDGPNLYMYCRGNPVSLLDRDGRRSGPSPDHDVLGQLTGDPVDSACTFNCGESFNGESQFAEKPKESKKTENKSDIKPAVADNSLQSSKKDIDDSINESTNESIKKNTEIMKIMLYGTTGKLEKDSDQKLYDNLKEMRYISVAFEAYGKGMQNLENKAFVNALYDIWEKTKAKGLEYGFTGKKGQKKFDIITGTKTSVPDLVNAYSLEDEYGAHSHPSLSALSHAAGKNEGDLEHSSQMEKNLYVITKSGEIYFTTPELARVGKDYIDGKAYSQVYLGNIKEFKRKK